MRRGVPSLSCYRNDRLICSKFRLDGHLSVVFVCEAHSINPSISYVSEWSKVPWMNWDR